MIVSLAKLLFLVAVILFVVAAIGTNHPHLVEWGLAFTAGGLLLEGVYERRIGSPTP